MDLSSATNQLSDHSFKIFIFKHHLDECDGPINQCVLHTAPHYFWLRAEDEFIYACGGGGKSAFWIITCVCNKHIRLRSKSKQLPSSRREPRVVIYNSGGAKSAGAISKWSAKSIWYTPAPALMDVYGAGPDARERRKELNYFCLSTPLQELRQEWRARGMIYRHDRRNWYCFKLKFTLHTFKMRSASML